MTATESCAAVRRAVSTRSVVTVRLLGGLGNQMFQYAAARAVAERTRAEVLLDLRGFESYTLRKPALHRWRIDARIASTRELHRYPEWQLWLSRRLASMGIATRCYNEPRIGFDPAVLAMRTPLHLNGYFQSEKYFAGLRPKLLEEFVPHAPLSPANRRIAQAAAQTNSISIHVRRGDYISDPGNMAVHGICDVGYYDRAIELLKKRTGSATYFVFSDDLDWARRNIHTPGPVFHVEGNENNPEMDIHLMARCRHNVCANSSFSWWGAWLNQTASKIVIAPARWFASSSLDASELVPADWIRLD